MKGRTRCRLHGGLSTGPITLEGLQRIRAANTKHGRFSAARLAFERAVRLYIRNGYRSARAMKDPRLRAFLLRWASEPIPDRVLKQMQQDAGDEVARQEKERLRAKGGIKIFP
jgi:hypothetical protein